MSQVNGELERLLDHLGDVVDTAAQDRIAQRYQDALTWRPVDRAPLVCTYPYPSDAPFQPLPLSRIYDDPAAMLYNEMVYAFGTSVYLAQHVGHDLPWTVRPNFGTGLVASVFGGRIEQIGENPPWVRPFAAEAQFRRAMDRDPQDCSGGLVDRVRQCYDFFRRTLQPYPKLSRVVHWVLPDLQGPFDTAEQLRGSDIFVDLYAAPALVQEALAVIARTQAALAQNLMEFVHDGPEGYTHQHGVMLPGSILIRNDTATMISPHMYRELVAGHDEYILREMGGGGIHCCGRFEDHLEAFLALPSVRCLDLGQSWLNDVDQMYRLAAQRNVPLLRVRADADEIASGRIARRFPTGVVLVHDAPTFADAQRTMNAFQNISDPGGGTGKDKALCP
jgi:hypothetical protein